MHIKKGFIFIKQLYLWGVIGERWFPILVHCTLKTHQDLGKFMHPTANFTINLINLVKDLILLLVTCSLYCKLRNDMFKTHQML